VHTLHYNLIVTKLIKKPPRLS